MHLEFNHEVKFKYKVDGTFSVFDKYLWTETSLNETQLQPELIYKVQTGKHVVLRYHLIVRKVDQIVIRVMKSTYIRFVIYDGPGFLSDILNAN